MLSVYHWINKMTKVKKPKHDYAKEIREIEERKARTREALRKLQKVVRER